MMQQLKRANDSVHWYMNELTSRIVAESGIPSDIYHLGKIILQSLKNYPDAVLQIDGATGESETNASALKRTIQCANGLRNLGYKRGDVMVLMAPSHLHLTIPYYAALFLGIAIAPIDTTLGVKELNHMFNIIKPKIIFCQTLKVNDIELVLEQLKLEATIITFDKESDYCSFPDFLERYKNTFHIEEFRSTDLEPEETVAFLVTTSGTTGFPKAVSLTHKNVSLSAPYLWSRHTEFPSPTKLAWVPSPLQWLTAVINFTLSPIMKYTRLQSSKPMTQDHAYYLINTYRPTFTISSPTFMTTLTKPGDCDRCDFTCFELMLIGGSAVADKLIDVLKKLSPAAEVVNAYGMTETSTIIFHYDYGPTASLGKLITCFQARVVNTETNEDITEKNKSGELWLKSPVLFKEYYNNPEATKQTYTDDGWFKTGDLVQIDENWNYFFMDRIKSMLKYKSYQISPVEVEAVIRQHPSVIDVSVIGVPDPECGDLPVACVIPRAGCSIKAQEIKDLVKESLSDAKQLRGGVIFLKEFPVTSTTKVHREKLKQMVKEMKRERIISFIKL